MKRIFDVDEIVILKSPYVDFVTEVSFRGYMEGDTKAMTYNPKSGGQMAVPIEWLEKKGKVNE